MAPQPKSTILSGCPSAQLASAAVAAWPVSVLAVAYPSAIATAMPAYVMVPAKPPLPCPRYLPFHPVSGSQISTLMSESGAGLSIAMTRQNAGKFFAEAGGAVEPGGMNAPAATGCVDVMVVSASLSVARLSQVAAKAGVASTIKRTSRG